MILVNGREVFWGRGHAGGAFPSGELRPVRSYFVSRGKNTVELRFQAWLWRDEELIYLWYIAKDLRELAYGAENTLVIPFLPNGRTNKEIGNEINIVPKLMSYLRALGFDRVVVYEPHSVDFVADYDDFCTFRYPTMEWLKWVIVRLNDLWGLWQDEGPGDDEASGLAAGAAGISAAGSVAGAASEVSAPPLKLVFPDAGAYYRYKALIPKELLANAILMNKVRAKDGRASVAFASGGLRRGASYLIVDDICDSGETAFATSKLISEETVKLFGNGYRGPNIALLVAHMFPDAVKIPGALGKNGLAKVFVCEDTVFRVEDPRVSYLCDLPESASPFSQNI